MINRKSLWKKIYLFFGFREYIQHIGNNSAYRIIYWCCFPWWKFYRKFDLFVIDVSSTKSISAQKEKDPFDIHPEWMKK